MISHRHGADELEAELAAIVQVALPHILLKVRPAYRPSRWTWEFIDSRDGSTFEMEFEYDSPDDARAAGLTRLIELTASALADPSSARRAA